MSRESEVSEERSASRLNTTSDLRWLLRGLAPKRKLQLGVFVLLSLMTVLAEMVTLGSLVPFIAIMIDPGYVDRYPVVSRLVGSVGLSGNVLAVTGALLALIVIASGVVRLLATWFGTRLSYGVGADMAAEVYRRTLYRPYAWHIAHNTSEVLAGVDKANQVTTGVILPITDAAVALLTSIGIAVMLVLIDPTTAIVASMAFTSVYGLMTWLLAWQVARNGTIVSRNATLRVRAIQEGLGGIRDVLLDGTQSVFDRRFATVDYEQKRAQAGNRLAAALPRYLIESAGMMLIIGLAFWLTQEEGGLQRAIPVLGALAFGAQKLMPQIQTLYQSWINVQGNRKQLADVVDLLRQPVQAEGDDLQTLPDPDRNSSHPVMQAKRVAISPPLNSAPGDRATQVPVVEFRDVGFRYREDLPPALTRVSMAIQRGDRVGFVGETGSGKSTLIDLIMALLTPSNGQILVDGQVLHDDNRRAWQRRIAHVPQAIYLSDASVAENIAFGVPLARIDMDRVRQAADRAQIASFIESMPQGYRATVGERGVRLSGGQRQRIGLARALYKGADVLVLDEATSALDDATEKSVMAAVNALDRGLTVFMIAHRISTLSDCNSIYRLHRGQAIHLGGFDALVKASASPL
jgi:ABC-type multidrug transport system fused ATPase/permease subunit